ncbi:MAG TPA: glycosyltransferase family 87 protein [Flavobacteriales bacterium]|nr:glycosyltransferase family 87 protein [Flavobacteriales bacterium]
MDLLRPYPRRFQLAFGLIALLIFVVEHINGRFWLNDFRVYYGAGASLLHGEPLYGVAHGLGTGIFKYAPLLAMVYALFALLPYSIAASIQYVLITLAFLDGIRRIDRLVRERLLHGKVPAYLPLFLIALAVVVHLHRELHLGNINMMLLWLLIVAVEQLDRGRFDRGGLLLGAAILAKPHFLVLLPLLVLHGQWRSLRSSALALLIGVLLPALFLGWQANLAVHVEWLGEMARHNAALIYTGGDDHRAVNTIYSFLHRAVLDRFLGAPSSGEAYVILGFIILAFGAFVLMNRLRKRTDAFLFEFLLLVGLVPSITLTDTEHFLFAMPLVAYLIHRLVPKADPRWLAFVAVPLLLGYGGNFEDALGSFSDVLVRYGALGIGSFGILLLTTCVWSRSNPGDLGVSNQR